MNGRKERAHPAGAGSGDSQACPVEEHGAQRGRTGEEREEVYDVLEHIVPRAGGEQPIVRRDECETRSGRAP